MCQYQCPAPQYILAKKIVAYMHILAYTCIYVQFTYVHMRHSCNIHAYTCMYMHIRAHTICRMCTYFCKMKYVYARMMYVYCAVFARICTYCTYMHVFFVWKVVRCINVRIIAHTCIYLQIRTQIRANSTCKYVRTYVQKFKDPVRFQRSYMHVYARICTYISTEIQHDTLIWTHMNVDRICMYMYVCVCI